MGLGGPAPGTGSELVVWDSHTGQVFTHTVSSTGSWTPPPAPVLGFLQAGKGGPLIPAEGSLFCLLLVLCSRMQPGGVETSTDILLDGHGTFACVSAAAGRRRPFLLTKLNPCGRGSSTLSSPTHMSLSVWNAKGRFTEWAQGTRKWPPSPQVK